MMSCFYLWLTSHGVTHVKGVINRVIAHLFKSAGYRFLGQPFQSHHSNLPCIAVLLDMSDLPITCKEFSARHAQRVRKKRVSVFMAENESMRPAITPSSFTLRRVVMQTLAHEWVDRSRRRRCLSPLEPQENAIDVLARARND
jgi:hypothetical protein